jgi:hypothetical protein
MVPGHRFNEMKPNSGDTPWNLAVPQAWQAFMAISIEFDRNSGTAPIR